MKQNFDQCLAHVLKYEGGYANHPSDPGGATMKGVTQAVYNGYRKRLGQAAADVRNITDAELRAIYRRQYWEVIKGDDLPSGVDMVVFDGAVNSGPSQSAKWLQRALNDMGASLKDDGIIGLATLNAMGSANDHNSVINKVCDKRLDMLRRLKTWPTFGKGWSNRVADVRSVGLSMIGAQKPAESDPPSDAPTQPKSPPSAWAAFFMAIVKLFGGKK